MQGDRVAQSRSIDLVVGSTSESLSASIGDVILRIGLFTDTYFPQVSGVATSIRTLKTELEKLGHTVFIFTTTDKDVNRYEDWQIIRIPSIPFFAFKDRRIAYRGFTKALAIAKQYKLDMIHTQTEFSLGLLGVWDLLRSFGFQ